MHRVVTKVPRKSTPRGLAKQPALSAASSKKVARAASASSRAMPTKATRTAEVAEDKRLRHPPGGGYARGEETRLRIIEAAIGVFGERGFDAATTREIAQRAGVNPPALQYYFENKDGVYRACAEHMASTSRARFDPVLARVEAALKAGITEEEAIDLFCDLLDVLVEHLLNSTDYRSRHLFVARVQSGHAPDEGIEALRRKVGHPINRAATALLSRLSGLSSDDVALRMKSLMLFGQVFVFHVARPMALHLMKWSDFDADSIAAVKKMVREQTATTLRGWLTELRDTPAKK